MHHIVAAAAVDEAWLTAALNLNGPRVTGFTSKTVGNGLVGTSVRFALQYDAPAPGLPTSVVGKFPATDSTSRQSGASMRLYQREVNFYRHIAPRVRIRTPHVHASAFNPETHDFFLLFEDLTPARAGDQLTGCNIADAALAMREIAGLHAPLWGDPSLDQLDWLGLPPAENEQLAQMVAPVAGMFRERFESVLEPDIMAAIMRLVPLARPLLLQQPKIRTVLHGDFRLDNILFEPRAGALPMATLDWQTIGQGCGTQDASYFLGAGLRAWDRAAHEQDLLRIYHETLQAQGVQDYPWQQCWQDYRKHSLNGLFMAMFSAIVVARTDRGDDMFLTMARRHARQALELGGFDLWA